VAAIPPLTLRRETLPRPRGGLTGVVACSWLASAFRFCRDRHPAHSIDDEEPAGMRRPNPSHRRRGIATVLAAGGTVAALTALSLPAAAAPAAAGPRALPGSVPSWVHSARDLGATPAGNTVDFGVLLAMRNPAGAVATLQRVSDPHSAAYGRWLSSGQFRSQFAPAAADVSAAQRWLDAEGFTVSSTLPSGMYIKASGTVSQVHKAFGVSLRTYSYGGKRLRANTTPVQLPAGAPSAIRNVVGLDDSAFLKRPASGKLPGPPPGVRFGVQPCSNDYYAQKIATDKPPAYGKKQPYTVCGYGPQQLRAGYGVTPLVNRGIDGRGVTVAITDAYASPTMLFDAQTYNVVHNQRRFANGQYAEIRPKRFNVYNPADAQGWYGEETLDVESVHALAPGAKVLYVAGSDDGNGLDDAWSQTIDYHRADIITNSWSYGSENIPQSLVNFYDQFGLEAALTGITDNFSTGDSGDETSGGTKPGQKAVGLPASDPYMSGIGGTSVAIGKDGNWLWEHGWSSAYSVLAGGKWTPPPPGTYSSGSGGGTSKIFAQPFYQKGKVPAAISKYYGGRPARAIPDISMPGDPNTGMLIGETQAFPDGTYWDQYRIGGTSLSSPLMAGVIAVADQNAGHSIGFANPLYYDMLGKAAVHDQLPPAHPLAQVRTNYTNTVDASGGITTLLQTIDVQTTTIHTRPGYDDETGVGSPGGAAFFAYLKRVTTR